MRRRRGAYQRPLHRWRGLWTRLPDLTFRDVALDPLRSALASVGAAAVGPRVRYLDIAYTSVEAAAGLDSVIPGLQWLLHAAAGLSPVEFHLALPLSMGRSGVDLPHFHRATSIQLHGRNLRLTLPLSSSDAFPKLEKLSLSGCSVDLTALVLRCPCLRVLRVSEASIDLDAGINIQSESLQKLFIRSSYRWTDRINIEAPMLKQLTLSFGTGDKLSVSVVAPILEKVSWGCSYATENDGLAPWGLSKLRLHAAESLVRQRGQRVITGTAGEDTWLQLSNHNVLSLQMTARGWFYPQLNFVQQIEEHLPQIKEHLVTDFSVLDLTMVYDDAWRSVRHVFGPFVLHLLGMHRIANATRRLQIHFLRPEAKGKCPEIVHVMSPRTGETKISP